MAAVTVWTLCAATDGVRRVPPLQPAPRQSSPRPRTALAAASTAAEALGRLDGAAARIPDVDLFLGMYVRREALLSSQIEGTDCTLDDIFTFEMGADAKAVPEIDVKKSSTTLRHSTTPSRGWTHSPLASPPV